MTSSQQSLDMRKKRKPTSELKSTGKNTEQTAVENNIAKTKHTLAKGAANFIQTSEEILIGK